MSKGTPQFGSRAATTAEFRRFADGLPMFVWTQQPDGTLDWVSQAFYDYVKLERTSGTDGQNWLHVVHPDDVQQVRARTQSAVELRTTYELELRLKPAGAGDDAYRWAFGRATPRFDEDGEFLGWLGTGIDVHDARLRGEQSATAAARLADEAESFHAMADSAPLIMWLARGDGWLMWYNRRWYEYTGQTAGDADGWDWQTVHHPDDLPRVMREWPQSIASGAPFEMEFRLRGVDGSFRMFLARAVPVRGPAGDIVQWFGTCTDIEFEYQLRMRESRIAQTFQEAALQTTLPSVPGLSFDAMYAPAQSDALVGGDWFDAFRLVDGRVVLSVGDVAGSGLAAAVTMASLRQSIRTATLINPDPIAVLDAVDRIVRDIGPDRFATAFVAVFDPIHREMRYASAGHPPPLLRQRDGRVTDLSHSALPLGLRQRDFAVAPSVIIDPGTLLVMYTDGLTEIGRDPVAGEAAVIATLRGLQSLEQPAHALYAAVVDGNGPHDDIAILSVHFAEDLDAQEGRLGIWRWTFDAADAAAAQAARTTFAALLAQRGMSDTDVVNAELVFAELVGNVFRYAFSNVRIALDFTGPNPVLHVLDEGTGFEHNPRLPTDVLSEHGRGLYIVSHLTEELSITRRTAGGSHMRAVLHGASD